jgi:hypothetical protein
MFRLESSSGYDWNQICSQDIRKHFGITKRLTHLLQKCYLTVIQRYVAKYKLIWYSLTVTLDFSVGNAVVCFRLLACLLCADLAGMCPASVRLLFVMRTERNVRFVSVGPRL